MQEELLEKLRQLSHGGGPITLESELQKDLGLDSLGMAQLLLLVEEDYGVPVPDPAGLRTVGDVWARVQNGGSRQEQVAGGWHDRLRQPAEVHSSAINRYGPRLDDFFDSEWSSTDRALTAAARIILRAWSAIWHRLEIRNLERLPPRGPYLICPNHQSLVDPLFLYARLSRTRLEKLLFIAWEGYFRRKPYSWLNRIGRVLPTGGPGRMPECLTLAYDGLKSGKIVCIFPEGGRTTTGDVMKPRLGAGILAHEAGVPIYPVRIDGALGSLSMQRSGMHFCRITLTVLEPILPSHHAPGNMEDYRQLMDRWRAAIRDA